MLYIAQYIRKSLIKLLLILGSNVSGIILTPRCDQERWTRAIRIIREYHCRRDDRSFAFSLSNLWFTDLHSFSLFFCSKNYSTFGLPWNFQTYSIIHISYRYRLNFVYIYRYIYIYLYMYTYVCIMQSLTKFYLQLFTFLSLQ